MTGFPPPTPDDLPTVGEPVGGVNRCVRCGSTEVRLDIADGALTCLFCRHEWVEERVNLPTSRENLAALSGTTVSSGAADIDSGADTLITLKCGGCGAEVVVNTATHVGARCHWCRHVLTLDEQIPNGAVPDAVLPFSVTHDAAVDIIRSFADKRRMFADRKFLRDFTPSNIVGVYMPYMVVDARATSDISGRGEVETRRYTRGSGKSRTTYYDADVYEVRRHVDFTVDDLTIEASAERSNMDTTSNTNNVINTILPFDTENAVKWNANYLTWFTSEKRDQDVNDLTSVLEHQLLSVARSQIEPSVNSYDRGVRWEREQIDIRGTRWIAMHLPVWLYSYYHQSGNGNMVHYIAVNGRSGEVMGSIPVSKPRLLAAAFAAGTFVEAAVIALLAAT
jgi:hypothetical protein